LTVSDEQELHRLAAMLETIDHDLERGSPQREALKKAGLALCLSFARGLRPEIEKLFEQLGKPLSDSERKQLRGFGIDGETAMRTEN